MNDPRAAAALRALGAAGDPCAREAIAAATVALDVEVARWESSGGPVRGHRVVLALPAALLARVHESPAAVDALHVAFAAAVAAQGAGESLVALELRWGGERAPAASPYRGEAPRENDAPPAPEELRRALVTYLREREKGDAAAIAATAALHADGAGVFVVKVGGAPGRVAPDIEAALVALLGRGRGVVDAR